MRTFDYKQPTGVTEKLNKNNKDGQRIAVIGSGISGMSAAYGLTQGGAKVTVFETEARLGGHAHTVTVDIDGQPVDVDTGFIVYNEQNYPNLVGLFDELGVETSASDMSFAASFNNGQFEYSGSGVSGLLARRRNITTPQFWFMIRDLIRFYKTAPQLFEDAAATDMTLGDFLTAHNFGPAFRHFHLLPMAAAIWSSPVAAMEDYPVETFLRFFTNHGLLSLSERPKWRTVTNGSRSYVNKIANHIGNDVRLNSRIKYVSRHADGPRVHFEDGTVEAFDEIVFACHAPQALALIDAPTALEVETLGAFSTHPNEVILHRDASFMPKRQRAWASWNYLDRNTDPDSLPCLTYWMNNLQPLSTDQDLFVTLNPDRPIPEEMVLRRFSYNHPAFDRAAIDGQQKMPVLQGEGGLWFAGAWMGYGFHEDGAESGLAIAEALTGYRRSWNFDPAHARVPLPHQNKIRKAA